MRITRDHSNNFDKHRRIDYEGESVTQSPSSSQQYHPEEDLNARMQLDLDLNDTGMNIQRNENGEAFKKPQLSLATKMYVDEMKKTGELNAELSKCKTQLNNLQTQYHEKEEKLSRSEYMLDSSKKCVEELLQTVAKLKSESVTRCPSSSQQYNQDQDELSVLRKSHNDELQHIEVTWQKRYDEMESMWINRLKEQIENVNEQRVQSYTWKQRANDMKQRYERKVGPRRTEPGISKLKDTIQDLQVQNKQLNDKLSLSDNKITDIQFKLIEWENRYKKEEQTANELRADACRWRKADDESRGTIIQLQAEIVHIRSGGCEGNDRVLDDDDTQKD